MATYHCKLEHGAKYANDLRDFGTLERCWECGDHATRGDENMENGVLGIAYTCDNNECANQWEVSFIVSYVTT